MKIAIFSLLLVIAVSSTPIVEHPNMFKIPDGFGDWKYVEAEALNEVDPHFVPENDIEFDLFTVNNPTVPQRLTWNDMGTVASSHFSSARDTKFIVHGWQR